MGKKSYILLAAIMITVTFCDKPPIEKPEKLLSGEKMIEMLTEIHIAEAMLNNRRRDDSLIRKSTSADFYYSILDKHEVTDTIFEKSFIFYASRPRQFEKMYRQIMNNLNEMEQEFSGRKNDMLDLEIRDKKQ